MRRFVVLACSAIVGAAALMGVLIGPARADAAGDAAAGLASAPLYESPAAQSLGFAEDQGRTTYPANSPRLAILAQDEVGNAGKLAAQIKSLLGRSVQTVGVVLVGTSGVTDFDAVSDSTTFCKGGADYAAQQLLGDVAGTRVAPMTLLQRYQRALAALPPDKGESSCASALAHHGNHNLRAWLWLLVAALVGVAGIAAFALYVRRTVRARGVEPVHENLPEWITDADAGVDDAAEDGDEQR